MLGNSKSDANTIPERMAARLVDGLIRDLTPQGVQILRRGHPADKLAVLTAYGAPRFLYAEYERITGRPYEMFGKGEALEACKLALSTFQPLEQAILSDT